MKYSILEKIRSVFLAYLVVSAEGFRIDRSLRYARNAHRDRELRNEEEFSLLEKESSALSHAAKIEEKISAETRAKFPIVIAVVAASVICTVGFTFMKQQYVKWEVQTEEASMAVYQKELYDYTNKSETLLTEMKNIMEKANGLSDVDKELLDEKLKDEAEHLASIQEEDIFEGESTHDQTTFLSKTQAVLNAKSKKIDLAYKTMSSVKKGVESVIALQTISAGGAAAGVASAAAADTTAASLGLVMLIFSIVRNLKQLSNLSKQLQAAKVTLKYAASDARNEGQKVYHHTKWGVCKVIGELHANIEEQTRHVSEAEGEEKKCEKGNSQAVARCFLIMLHTFWKDQECGKFMAHEFRKKDVVEWKKAEDSSAQTGTVDSVDPEGFYRVSVNGGGKTRVDQRDLYDADKSVGLVPPIRGHGIVTNVAVSNDCFIAGSETFKNFETVCSRSYDLDGDEETSRICELNKAIPSETDLTFVSDLYKTCAQDDDICKKMRAIAIAKADKTFRRATCESGKIKRHAEDLEKSRSLVIEHADARDGDEADTRAIYKLDLHTLYVPKDGDWSSAAAQSFLMLPGWVEKSKYPKTSKLVPSFLTHMWRDAKRHVMPNVNLNALALTRGIDFSVVHFLASRWDFMSGDVMKENKRKRCGVRGEVIAAGPNGPSHLRWLSVCQKDQTHTVRHANPFRESLEKALAKGQDDDHSSEKMRVSRLQEGDLQIGKPVVVFWREGEKLECEVEEKYTHVKELLSKQSGPCYMVGSLGTVSRGIKGALETTILIKSVSPICGGSDNARVVLQSPSNEMRSFIKVPMDDANMYREAALVLRNQPCERALDPNLPCKTSAFSMKQTLKRKVSHGTKGKKQFHLRLSHTGDDRVAVAKFVGTTNDSNGIQMLKFHVRYPQEEDRKDLELNPAQVVVAAIMSDPHIARNYRSINVGNHERSVLRGHCAVNELSIMDEPMYDACVRLLLNQPHTAVDDSPGWSQIKSASMKLEAKHELLPDLRFRGKSSDPGLYAFMARKSERTEDQPPIRHMRLTLGQRDPPDGSVACNIDNTCAEGDEKCLGAVVRDMYRHECNYYRITTSLGDGLASDAAHGIYVWVKRRFAIDPCKISTQLGGWKNRDGSVTEKWRKACEKVA